MLVCAFIGQEEDFRRYCASLFAIPVSRGGAGPQITTPESFLTIEVLDEVRRVKAIFLTKVFSLGKKGSRHRYICSYAQGFTKASVFCLFYICLSVSFTHFMILLAFILYRASVTQMEILWRSRGQTTTT